MNGPESLGHKWERETNIMGQTLLSMRCQRCGRQWLPHETLKQIGRCPTAGPHTEATED